QLRRAGTPVHLPGARLSRRPPHLGGRGSGAPADSARPLRNVAARSPKSLSRAVATLAGPEACQPGIPAERSVVGGRGLRRARAVRPVFRAALSAERRRRSCHDRDGIAARFWPAV